FPCGIFLKRKSDENNSVLRRFSKNGEGADVAEAERWAYAQSALRKTSVNELAPAVLGIADDDIRTGRSACLFRGRSEDQVHRRESAVVLEADGHRVRHHVAESDDNRFFLGHVFEHVD